MRRTCKRKPRQGGFFSSAKCGLHPGAKPRRTVGLRLPDVLRGQKNAPVLAEHWTHKSEHGDERQHRCQVHSAAGRKATDRHGTHEGKNKGRFGAQRQSALYDPPYLRGGELQAGKGLVSPAKPKAHQKKKVRAKLGPVRRFVAGQRAG